MKIRAEDETNNFTLLRLLLALAVVFGHFKLLSGTAYPPFPFNLADAAVDCFFVVSGFLITLSCTRTNRLLPFYVRRFFRLYPMYACIVAIQTAILMSMLPQGPFSRPDDTLYYLVANLSFANFLHPDLGGVLASIRVPSINPSLWTLKIEMGFYLIVPFIIAAVRRYGFPVLLLIFVGSAAYAAVTTMHGDARFAKQLPGQLQFFVVGMALYLYARDFRVPTWVSAVVTVGFLAAWTYLHPIQPVVSPLLVGAFVFCFALCTPVVPMRTDMSYSVYLLHGPLIQTGLVLGVLLPTSIYLAGVLAAVLALSFVFEHLVERPGNEFGRRLSRRLGRVRAPATVPDLVA